MHPEKENTGFSMIEVVVSLGLLIMIFGLLPLMTVIQNANTYSSGSTAMTNIAMSLSEGLGMLDFETLGGDAWSGCTLPADGKVINGTSQGLCVEGPLNQLGYTGLENSTDDVFYFYRLSVVCTDSNNLPGGYTGDICSIPSSNLVGGPVPDELSCAAANYTNSQKEIKVAVYYRDKRGKCKSTVLRSLKTVY